MRAAAPLCLANTSSPGLEQPASQPANQPASHSSGTSSRPSPAAAAPTRHPRHDFKLLGREAQLLHHVLRHKVAPGAAVVAARGHRQPPHAAARGDGAAARQRGGRGARRRCCLWCCSRACRHPRAGRFPRGLPRLLHALARPLPRARPQREVGGGAAEVLAKRHPGRRAALQARNLRAQQERGGPRRGVGRARRQRQRRRQHRCRPSAICRRRPPALATSIQSDIGYLRHIKVLDVAPQPLHVQVAHGPAAHSGRSARGAWALIVAGRVVGRGCSRGAADSLPPRQLERPAPAAHPPPCLARAGHAAPTCLPSP